ncbi:MAG: hypothetical protein LBE31_03415 [Deltaproteobacteria bacterium]|jgi:hypothetical protein|nr:hypothetical protein [Deltaproteobacteria bacterium]
MTAIDLRQYPFVTAALNDPLTVKVLGLVTPTGEPHLAVKSSLKMSDSGGLKYDEIIETSRTNSLMLRALWFFEKVAVSLITTDGLGWLLKGRPERVVISGQEFRRHYEIARSNNPQHGLGAVWFIEIETVTETTLEKRRQEEEESHPLLIHLDRLLVNRPDGQVVKK